MDLSKIDFAALAAAFCVLVEQFQKDEKKAWFHGQGRWTIAYEKFLTDKQISREEWRIIMPILDALDLKNSSLPPAHFRVFLRCGLA